MTPNCGLLFSVSIEDLTFFWVLVMCQYTRVNRPLLKSRAIKPEFANIGALSKRIGLRYGDGNQQLLLILVMFDTTESFMFFNCYRYNEKWLISKKVHY